MSRLGIARAFARALLGGAANAGEEDAALADIRLLRTDREAHPALCAWCDGRFSSTPDERERVVLTLWEGRVSPNTLAILRQMARWDVLPSLAPFLDFFEELLRRKRHVHVAHAAFAIPPTDDDLATLRERLQARFPGETVEMDPSVRPNLLAGFRVEVDDLSADASLASRIRRDFAPLNSL